MSQKYQDFQAAAVGDKFTKLCVAFDRILIPNNSQAMAKVRQKMRDKLKEYHEANLISVAFVGQYSAGKSTIISALTGRRDIPINADLTTEKTVSYHWNGIEIIDTPGLFTDRQDHDKIAYEAIAKSDLLVFCLTSMLFDSVTVANFKKLAYIKGYRWKIMLVVNKMSDEAGDDEEKIANYRRSLAEALHPQNLDEFPICFIDGKDYCEGIDTKDNFLVEVSRFSTFIETINQFVQDCGYLTRFDTPTRIALDCVDEAQLSLGDNSNQNLAFWEILTRLSSIVRKERDRFRTKVQNIILSMSFAITQEGIVLASGLDSDIDFDQLNQQTELNIQGHYEKAAKELVVAINIAVNSIKQKISDFLQGKLVQTLITSWDRDPTKIATQNFGNNLANPRRESQSNSLIEMANIAGVSPTILTRQTDYSQEDLVAGKFVGFQFKPWDKVKSNKTITYRTDDNSNFSLPQIASQYQAMAKYLEYQIKLQLRELESQVYDEIEDKINRVLQEEENALSSVNKWFKQLAIIRQDFNLILRYITTARED